MSSGDARENFLIDIIKLVCILAVACGHCCFVDIIWMRWIYRFVAASVQILFIFSGYYAVKRGVLSEQGKMQKYVSHLMKMLLGWQIIYFVVSLPFADKSSPIWWETMLRDTVVNFCSLNSGHFWYVQNLILVVVLLFCFQKQVFSMKELLGLFAMTCVLNERLDRSIFGFAVGCFLANIKQRTQSQNRRCWLLAAVAGILMCMMSYVEIVPWDFGNGILANLFMNLFAVFVATAALQTNFKTGVLHTEKLGYYIRKISTGIYVVHLLILQGCLTLAARHAAWGTQKFFWWSYAYLICGSVAISILMITLSSRKEFKWLKNLY